MSVRILIADDHQLFREGLKQLLGEESSFSVEGEAQDGGEVISLLRNKTFDIIVLDMSMPGISGIELINYIKREKARLPILVLSMHKEGQYAVRALKAGASGYLTKDSASSVLVNAIKKVAAGGMFVTPEVAERLAYEMGEHRGESKEGKQHELLSDREFQIFKMIVSGMPIVNIAKELSLSAKTVSTHKTRILQKMGMSGTVELVSYSIRNDLSN